MASRSLLVLFCLFFSGLAALVYQVIWTRLLGFAFGTTTEAIGTVLAVFFGGMALGNALAARHFSRVERPLRVYALLELAIGVFALVSLPLLWRLETVYAWVGADHGVLGAALLRIATAALVLLPPTVAMGATLPVVARALVAADASLGRWSAYLYTANTLGAVAGAYLSGFWLIPGLGLGLSVVLAALVNLAVAAAVLVSAAHVVATPEPPERPLPDARMAPEARAGARAERVWYLVFFGISGFVAIGYEIVWSKTFSVLMEGTLYGFSSVLSAYLLGIALGSLAISGRVDRVRDLPRLFGGLHLAIGACVALGMVAVPWLPWAFGRLIAWSGSEDILHLAFLVILPIVLLPTALFGAAFPVLIRLYSPNAASVGRGMGVAVAVNTAGSIASSLLVGFWWIPSLGSDATLYVLLLLDLAAGFLVVLRFQTTRGRERLAGLAAAAVLVLGVATAYNGAHLERALVGRWVGAPGMLDYRGAVDSVLANTRLVLEGRHAVVSVHEESWGRRIRTNGMPEASRAFAEPYNSTEVDLLGILPYLVAETPRRGLVIGFGGGGTVDALTHTALQEIEVVELEGRVIEAADTLYAGVPLPLEDPRVRLHVNDGRHHLLLRHHRGEDGYDVIASQPSHPWLAGAANLFTEDFFSLVRDNLSEGGVFALWLNGFRIDPESALAVMTSFDRVFPGGHLVGVGGESSPWSSLVLLGGRRPVVWRSADVATRLAEDALSRALALHGFVGPESLLALFEGPIGAFAALEPQLSNTDDNAFLEARIPRMRTWGTLDPTPVLERLPDDTPVLPPIEGELDLAALSDALFEIDPGVSPWPLLGRARRLHDVHGEPLGAERALRRARVDLRDPGREADARGRLEALAERPALRRAAHRVLGLHAALRRNQLVEAARHFEAAFAVSGAAQDAYDAARAWRRVDRDTAWRWAQRVPPAEREAFPRLALYAAEAALARGAAPSELAAVRDALLRYRDTEEGRRFDGVNAVLAELALRLGDRDAARAFGDADRRDRQRAAGPVLAQLDAALTREDGATATRLLAELRRLAPSDLSTLHAVARVARARDDTESFEAALAEIERWSPTLAGGRFEAQRIRRSARALDAPEPGATPPTGWEGRAPPEAGPANAAPGGSG